MAHYKHGAVHDVEGCGGAKALARTADMMHGASMHRGRAGTKTLLRIATETGGGVYWNLELKNSELRVPQKGAEVLAHDQGEKALGKTTGSDSAHSYGIFTGPPLHRQTNPTRTHVSKSLSPAGGKLHPAAP